MKKRIIVATLAMILAMSSLPISASATDTVTLPESQKLSFELDYPSYMSAELAPYFYNGAGTDYDYQDVTITVTVEGYLGELDSTPYVSEYARANYYDMGIDFPIIIIEKDSKVILDIDSSDPMASYNYFMEVDLSNYEGYNYMSEGAMYSAGYDNMGNPGYPYASPDMPNTLQIGWPDTLKSYVTAVDSDTWELTPAYGLSTALGLYSTGEPSAEEIAEMFAPIEEEEASEETSSGSSIGNMTSSSVPTGAMYDEVIYNYLLPAFLAVDQGDIDELAEYGKAHIYFDSVEDAANVVSEDYAQTYYDESFREYPGLLEAFGAEPVVTTYGQSNITLVSVGAADVDYNQFDVCVSNNTEFTDKGSFAFVVASDRAHVRIEEYELEPYSSQIISITEQGHFWNNTNSMFTYLTNGWADVINASIIKFESDEEMAEYKSLIVAEKNTTHISSMYPDNEKSTLVCLDTAGENWLKEYAGITYKTAPYIYPEHDHSICGE